MKAKPDLPPIVTVVGPPNCERRDADGHYFCRMPVSETVDGIRMCSNHASIRLEWNAAGRPPSAQSIAKVSDILSSPKPSPVRWRENAARDKRPLTRRYGMEAMSRMIRDEELPEREPGCDDE